MINVKMYIFRKIEYDLCKYMNKQQNCFILQIE